MNTTREILVALAEDLKVHPLTAMEATILATAQASAMDKITGTISGLVQIWEGRQPK